MIATLAQARAQLNVTAPDDDALINDKIAAAQAYVERWLGYAIEDEYTEPPAALVEAVLLIVAHWFENRETSLVGVSADTIPHGADAIISEYRRYDFGLSDG